MTKIRLYQAGDDAAQVSIYNEAAAALPGFKPATLDEVRRRSRDPACTARGRFMAVINARPMAYATYQTNGRVSLPWCRKGQEALAEPLLQHVLDAMKAEGLTHAWAAYRADWKGPLEFLQRQGFEPRREMVNFMLDFTDMPTPTSRPNTSIGPLSPEDVPAVMTLGQGILRVHNPAALVQHLFHNPYFPATSLYALRDRSNDAPLAVGVIVANPSYSKPQAVDSRMPCFRLGAFGTEGLTAKRINGLFSFVSVAGPDLSRFGLDLMAHIAFRLEETDVETFAAQVPSDAAHLLRFYNQYFRRQGSFPVLERSL